MSDKELSIAAMKLSRRKRAMLAERLLESLDEEGQEQIDRAWAKESEGRIDIFNAGTSQSKPLGQVSRKLKGQARR